MSKKFSFLVSVDGDKLSGKVYEKKDAQKCIDEFNKARDAGKEVYLFQHPVATKSSKSSVARQEIKESLG